MNNSLRTSVKILRLWPALPILAGMFFSPALWAEDTPEAQEKSQQQPAENDSDQAAEEPATPSDFKPSEEISEDFPVPLPSDI
jgi:hemolysin activation/secretion protein